MSAMRKKDEKVSENKGTVTKQTGKAVKKTSTRKAVMSKPSSEKNEGRKPSSTVMSTLASREDFFVQIQKEAYYLAEKDGFAGDPISYWFAAEANVQRRVKQQ